MAFLLEARKFYQKLPKGLVLIFLLVVLVGIAVWAMSLVLSVAQAVDYVLAFPVAHPVITRFLATYLSPLLVLVGVVGLSAIFLWATFHPHSAETPIAPAANSSPLPGEAAPVEPAPINSDQIIETLVSQLPEEKRQIWLALERGEALLPSPPPPVTVTLVEQDDVLFLRVTNPGPTASFRVALNFESTEELDRPRGLVYGVWHHEASSEVEIRNGESRDLVVAERVPYSHGEIITAYYVWSFPCFDGTEIKAVTTRKHFSRRYEAEIWEDQWDRLPDDLELALRLDILAESSPVVSQMVNFRGALWHYPNNPLRSDGPLDSIERFKESYPIVGRAVVYASEYLTADLFGPAQANAAHALLVTLLGQYIAGPCIEAKQKLDFDLSIPAPMYALVNRIRSLLFRYGVLLSLIKRTAQIILGEQVFQSEGYAGLYRRHNACVEELQRLGRRSEWGAITANVNDLSQLLTEMPPPITETT